MPVDAEKTIVAHPQGNSHRIIVSKFPAWSLQKGQALPITVWLEMEKFDTDAQEENCIPAVIICNEKSNFRFKENCKYLCLTADNRSLSLALASNNTCECRSHIFLDLISGRAALLMTGIYSTL